MTAKEGRKKSVRVLVAVGNGNGAAGEEKLGGGGRSWARPESPCCCSDLSTG